MKRRLLVIIIICLFLVLLTLSVSACEGDPLDNTDKDGVVYYYMNGVDGERKSLTVSKGDMYTIPDIPQKEGYTLLGFFDSEIGGTKFANAMGESIIPFNEKSDLVLYAYWQANQYDIVIFDAQDSLNELATLNVSYDSTMDNFPYINEKQGYAFIGLYDGLDKDSSNCYSTSKDWLRSKKKFNFEEYSISNNNEVILYAFFEPVEFFTVDFYDDNDALIERKSIPYGINIDVLSENDYSPKKSSLDTEYKTLIGWSTEKGSNKPQSIQITSDLNLYSVWSYTIKFNVKYDETIKEGNDEINAFANAKIDIPVLNVKPGYTFNGWYVDGVPLDNYMPKFGGEANAEWIANEYNIVIFDASNPVLELTRITATYDEEISEIPQIEDKDGYRFAGLYNTCNKTGTCYFESNKWKNDKNVLNFRNFTLSENGNINLFAVYSQLFNINYFLNDGINDESNPAVIAEDETVYLANATKNGYNFMGWYSDSKHSGKRIYYLSPTTTKDVDLYAYYELSSRFSFSQNVRDRSGGEGTTINKNNSFKVSNIVKFTTLVPYEALKKAGYTKVNILVLIEMKEHATNDNVKNKVAVYMPNNSHPIGWLELAHHKGGWGYHRMEVNNVNLSSLYTSGNNFEFSISYGCDKKHFNDWDLGNVKVEITIVR